MLGRMYASCHIQDLTRYQLLLLCCLCCAQLRMHAAQEQLETGWSNGRVPAAGTTWTVQLSKCQPGTFIESWIVGEGDISASSLRSVVSIQAKCSDGALLDALIGSTQPVVVRSQRLKLPCLSTKRSG
jgi:hypothetical protein